MYNIKLTKLNSQEMTSDIPNTAQKPNKAKYRSMSHFELMTNPDQRKIGLQLRLNQAKYT